MSRPGAKTKNGPGASFGSEVHSSSLSLSQSEDSEAAWIAIPVLVSCRIDHMEWFRWHAAVRWQPGPLRTCRLWRPSKESGARGGGGDPSLGLLLRGNCHWNSSLYQHSEADSAWLIAGFDVHVSASGSAAMGEDASDDAVRQGTLDRLASLEEWAREQTASVSRDLQALTARVTALEVRMTALEGQVTDRDIPALRGRTTELRRAFEFIQSFVMGAAASACRLFADDEHWGHCRAAVTMPRTDPSSSSAPAGG